MTNSTLTKKYTVNPDHQAEFDKLQKETIDFVLSNDKVMLSIHRTIEQLRHLLVVVKLRNKAQPVVARYQQGTPSTSSVHTMPHITAKSSVVDDIARMIEVYNTFNYSIDMINTAVIKDLEKLGMQDISDDEEMQWYQESLRFKKSEAADFSEEVKALKPLSDVAIAQGKAPKKVAAANVVAPKAAEVRELSEGEKVGFFFLFCALIVIYMWHKSYDATKVAA